MPEKGAGSLLQIFGRKGLAAVTQIQSIELIGSGTKVEWSQKKDGLHLVAPDELPNEMALVYKARIK